MDGFELIDGFLQIKEGVKKSEMSENEKLFLLLSIMPNSYYLIQSYIGSSNYWFYERYVEYIGDIEKYLSTICSSPNNNLIRDFGYFADSAKQYYKLLSKDEKINAIRILNDTTKMFLKGASCSGEVYRNVYNLSKFFKNMYYVTDGTFKYEKDVAYYLLNTNKYKKNKAFFNALATWVISLKQYFIGTTESSLIAIDNVENILSEASINFNASMAKLLLK